MQELLTKLGIDWRLLIAQLVNFGVLILVLYRFAYRPLLDMLEKRRTRIAASIAEAERIESESKRMEQLKRQKVTEAKREAAAVMEDASHRAEQARQESVQRTRQESEKIVLRAKEQITRERVGILRSVQEEAAVLVAGAVEKVLDEKMDLEKDKKFIERALQQMAGLK